MSFAFTALGARLDILGGVGSRASALFMIKFQRLLVYYKISVIAFGLESVRVPGMNA